MIQNKVWTKSVRFREEEDKCKIGGESGFRKAVEESENERRCGEE